MSQITSRFRDWLTPVVYLANNIISLIGVVMVTTATIMFIALLPTFMSGTAGNPYLGLLVFLIFPGVFIGGLVLIPIGILIKSRQRRSSGLYPESFPPLDFKNHEFKKLIGFVAVTSVINVVIAGQLTYSAVNYMEGVEFCGRTCHTVMQPEYTAYQNSPHARVECVKCHIGPGAGWFVKSKLSGVRQVFAVTFHTYSTPIPTPVRDLRPARETCETCHWPQKFGGERLRVLNKYADDEANSLTKTALLMKIGGGVAKGIHGMHMATGVQMRYYPADESRQTIPLVEYNKGDGSWVRFVGANVKPEDAAKMADSGKLRVMDCMDCHNRPSHSYLLPERAMDNAMTAGQVSPALPFAKKQALTLLKSDYATQDEARGKIIAGFEKFYQDKYPQIFASRKDEVSRSAAGVATVYTNNIFPEMKVKWGSYPNNIGHMDFPGCFRCHDGDHAATTGAKIEQDCNACHSLLATEEASPKILTDLGIAPPPAGGTGGGK